MVLFLENRSFDHLYGMFPGADGVDNAGFAALQVTAEGRQFVTLPAVINNPLASVRVSRDPPLASIRASRSLGLPNGPIPRRPHAWACRERTGDPIGDRFYQEQEQIDDGRMDKFVAVSGAGAAANGLLRRQFADASTNWLPGNTRAGRQVLPCCVRRRLSLIIFGLSCMPAPRALPLCASRVWSPSSIQTESWSLQTGAVTSDGYAVNTIRSGYRRLTIPESPTVCAYPPQTMPTIGRLFDRRGCVVGVVFRRLCVDAAFAGHPDPSFIPLSSAHSPTLLTTPRARRGAPNTCLMKRDMICAIRTRTLPAVSFYKPVWCARR